MGTAESSQSPEHGGLGGFTTPSSFRRQSPNVARLIHGENSQKMEYEFPISEATSPHHLGHFRHHSNSTSTSNHTIISAGKTSRLAAQPTEHNDRFVSGGKLSAGEPSSVWSSLTSCFACRSRDAGSSTMHPLRDKVHAIRIVRASNDLTPAVFDSHYNIITLEQLRECDNTGSGNVHDSSDSNSPESGRATHAANGSVASAKAASGRRLKKKKKKRAGTANYAVKSAASDDDDSYERT